MLTYPSALEKCTKAAVRALRSGTAPPSAGDVLNTPKWFSHLFVCEPACDVDMADAWYEKKEEKLILETSFYY